MVTICRRFSLLVGLLILMTILAACMGGGSSTPTYTVSGIIVDDNDNPIENVTLHFSGSDRVAHTNDEGKWSQVGLQGSVTVTPTHDDYTFDPPSRNVTKTTSDVRFTGTAKTTPHEPLAVTIQVDEGVTEGVAPGQKVTLTAHVTGSDPTDLVFDWSADQGNVEKGQPQSTATWTAPAAVGTWTVTVYAITSGNETARDRVQIPVVHTMPCDSGDVTNGNNPCRISTLEQLQAMRHHVNGHFMLTADIDASDSVFLNDGHGFDPIGITTTILREDQPFSGTFNGNGHTIEHLYIRSQNTTTCAGLFGVTGETAQIKNITLDDVDVAGSCVGGLVGENEGTIQNASVFSVHVEGTSSTGVAGGMVGRNLGTMKQVQASGVVESNVATGGLVGINRASGEIENGTFRFEVGNRVVGGNSTGGLVGSNEGTITQSRVFLRANHDISGQDGVGGLVGRAGQFGGERGPKQIRQSFVYGAGDIVGENGVGGLGGVLYDATVESSYAFTDTVQGHSNVGGLAGHADGFDTVITESYAITSRILPANGVPGGFIGERDVRVDDVERSYWSSSQQNATGTSGSQQKTLTEMTQAGTFVGWSSTLWNFSPSGDPFPDLRTNPRE